MRKVILAVVLTLLSVPGFSKEVLISFDGSGYLDMWEDTLNFAKDNHVKFTYFISSPYFMTETEEQSNPYWAMHELTSSCLIKPRKDNQENNIQVRIKYLQRAIAEGHDIGSHFCGHYDGSKWTYEQWMKEMSYFSKVMTDIKLDNGATCPMKWITGARAPYLGTNPDYFKALKDSGYTYDSSCGSVTSVSIIRSGVKDITEIPIRRVEILENGQLTGEKELAFDCDFVSKIQWKKYPDAKKETFKHYSIEQNKDMENIYFDSLCWDYTNNPVPTEICLHFQHRPGEPYYNAMKRFVAWAKDKNPKYLTYSEYAKEQHK